MPKNSAKQSKTVSGSFVASFVHPKTGKRIFAKDYGKRAFFIPYVNANPARKDVRKASDE